MATEWSITTAAERFTLDAQNRGEITFTVTNPSARPDRAVVEPVRVVALCRGRRVGPGGAGGGWHPGVRRQR
jgi:hypothetical protein